MAYINWHTATVNIGSSMHTDALTHSFLSVAKRRTSGPRCVMVSKHSSRMEVRELRTELRGFDVTDEMDLERRELL